MKGCSLSLLGPFAATVADRPLLTFRTNRVQALLIYLAVEQAHGAGGHRREGLLDLLWPGMPQSSAQHNLRQTIYQLRKAVPDVTPAAAPEPASLLLADRQTVRLNPDYPLVSDVARLQQLLRGQPDHWLEAVVLYRGDFLSDFSLPDAATFEAWAAGRRAAYRQQVLDALASLSALKADQGFHEEAAGHARRQIEIDDLRESAYRQLMSALARSGRRSEALRWYDSCRQALQQELGVGPEAETDALRQTIYDGELERAGQRRGRLRSYELKEQVGAGSFGAVYRALQPGLNREVAVKIILPKYANDADFIRRFENEAQVVARLEHPYIVPLYDFWREPGNAYLVMRWLRSGSLERALAEGGWEAEAVLQLVEQVASALHAAHQRGIVHRDLKPANILLDEQRNAYLTDFGIAVDVRGNGDGLAPDRIMTATSSLSPEQIRNEPITAATDLYGLGLVVYQALAGQPPFPDQTLAGLMYKHLHEPLPLVRHRRPDLPPAVDEVIQKATAKVPVNRYTSALEMAQALRQALAAGEVVAGLPEPAVLAELENPYRGLLAFTEADAGVFYGREAMVERLLARLQDDGRFLVVIGPSGSGKSSLVHAGLLPALRRGALPGSADWFVVAMMPGAHPFEELEAALLRVAVRQPPSLLEQLQAGERGLLRAVRRVLPDDRSRLLLIVDQFEELFTMTAAGERDHFLQGLQALVTAAGSPVTVVLTLRADFYDRPLLIPGFSDLVRQYTEVVLPLTAAELSDAIRRPVEQTGVQVEPVLVSRIVADVVDQPGSLPLLQHTLADLFEQRSGARLSLAGYEALGGVAGALAHRAESLYLELDDLGRQAARQLFLRLVTLGEGTEDTRRRVRQTELLSLALKEEGGQTAAADWPAAVGHVIETFGRARLLSFDRDPLTRGPTVEVAHEALLRQWPRLRAWLDAGRADVHMQRLLAAAAAEWRQAGQEAGYLLRGGRLDQFEQWAAGSTVALAAGEQAFLAASRAARALRRDEEEQRRRSELETAQKLAQTERQRAEEQARAAQRLRQRAAFLTGALAIAAILAVLAFTFARSAGQNATLAATREVEALTNAELAATRAAEAVANAALAATREGEALSSAELAAARQAEAEAEANLRAAAEAAAIGDRETAEQQARLAFSRELVASSILNLEEDPERSILLALHALTQADTFQAQEALHEALQNSHLLQRASAEPGEGFAKVAVSPDGARLAVVVIDPERFPEGWTTQVRDAATLEVLFTLPGTLADDRWVYANRLPTINSGDDPATSIITIWDVNGLPLFTTLIPIGWNDMLCLWDCLSLDVSSDLALIAVSTWDGLITIFDVETGDTVQTLGEVGERFRIWPTFSPDGKLLGANNGSPPNDQGLVIWEINTGRQLWTRPTNQESHVAFSRDGKQLAYSPESGMITVVDITSGQDVLNLTGHTGQIIFMEFDASGSRLVTIARDGSVRIWDTSTRQSLFRLGLDTSGTVFAAFTPDSTRLVTTVGSGAIQVWGLDPTGNREWLTLSGGGNCGLAFSPDGNLLAIASCDNNVRVLDAISGQPVITLTSPISPAGAILAPVFSPDGTRLAALRPDNMAVVWDLATSQETMRLTGHTDVVWRLAFSPDGTRLATIAYDKTARLWDVTTGAMLYILNDVFTEELTVGGHSIDVTFSPDGSKLATAAGFSVKVWETATGKELLALPPNQINRFAYTVAFSLDGSRLAVGLQFGRGSGVWDAATGEKLFDLSGHLASVGDITYSPDGRQIATTAGDRTIRLWDAATGATQLTLQAYLNRVATTVAYSPDGTRLATQGLGGTVRIYAIRLEDLVLLARSRLTRWFTPEECRQYLHVDECPAVP